MLRRHRVTIASATVVAVAAASLVAYAISATGYAVHHASLNDGGVWVTKGSTGQFGRLNKPVGQLDGAVYTVNPQGPFDIDVLQDGAAVVAVDRGRGQLYPLDVSQLKVDQDAAIALPAGALVGIGGGVLAILDRAKGVIRALSFDPRQPLASIAALASSKPLASVGPDAALAVGTDGTVYAASAARGLTTIRHGSAGFRPAAVRALGVAATNVALTAVGDAPVVLAGEPGAAAPVAILPDGTHLPLPGASGAVLQQPGPAADAVLLATPHAVLSVPLSGSPPRQLFQGGTGNAPAAPVRLGGCDFAAWPGTVGVFASACGAAPVKAAAIPQPSTALTFRVNHQELLLNDTNSGDTWNIDSGTPRQVADWAAVTPPPVQKNTQTKNNDQDTHQNRPLPPKAVDVALGARPGRTTSLHVLDFDSDPSGEILSIDSVSAAPQISSWLSIAPDGQTVSIALPAGTTSDTTFKYVVRAAKGGTASATVTVHARKPSQVADPTLRKGATAHTWSVPESGTVTISALTDWRDYPDGDPVVLTGATATAGHVAATPDGSLIYTAPAQPGTQTIAYTVGTGMGGKNHGTITVAVQGTDGKPVAATAEPDYARGEVGKPIVVEPLRNDLPGSDPLNPTATMVLAGPVSSPPGATVHTDTASGRVVVTASKPGSYLLNYQVAYGSAPLAKGVIRVDVDPAATGKPPVVAPVTAVLHGQAPITVDVLANAADPAGNLLVVQHAAAADPAQLTVAVVDGRFVRLQANTATMRPATQTVRFTVTDGVTAAVSGEITVTQLPPPADDTPITITDYARVRAGESVAIPVLDNDSTPAGDPVSLVPDVPTAPAPGRYTVTPALGAAYVSGRYVRYVAPPTVTKATTVTIDYYAQDQAGDRQQVGHAQVTITPPVSKTNPDQPPNPGEVDARAVAGDTVTIRIPTDGVDPDGDPVVVTGIGSAPQLGRVLGSTATSITYQAYPQAGNGGTDSFSYVVSDPYGMTADGTIRVAVVPPGDPQPPVAVDDAVTIAPSATVRLDVLANDIVAPDDHVTIGDLRALNPQLPAGVRLLSPAGPIEVTASGDPKRAVVFRYQISDGTFSSRATITVRSQAGVHLPPIAFDQYAQAKPGATDVTVDLLHGDYAADSTGPLTVVSPAGAAAGKVTVRLTGDPQVIPYVIRDANGAQASAVVYVPGAGAGAPYAKPGAQIAVPYNGTVTVAIADYVVDPAQKPLRTTTSDTISASPATGLTVSPGTDATHLVLHAGHDYNGPAAVTFQVTDGATLATPGASRAYVSVPVQVGAATPQLRCPSTPIVLMEGGPATGLPIASLCHVWTPNQADLARLTFTGRWARQPAGVDLAGNGSAVLSLRATGSASPGQTGVLSVTVDGATTTPQQLTIQVIKAPPLTVAPIVLTGIQAGHAATVDLAAYVQSPLGADARISIVGTPREVNGMPATISASGSRVTVQPAADSHGTLTFALVVTDVSDQSRSDRQVPAQLTVQVLGHPDQPSGLAASRTVKSDEVDLTWTAPADNGSPIDHYVVDFNGGSQRCGGAPACAITGLRNGASYTFTVTAYNAVGASPPSASTSATPDKVPPAVSGFAAANPQNGALSLSWAADSGDWSAVTSYVVSWQGGTQQVPGSSTSLTATGLNNDTTYDFTIIAVNKQGPSAPSHASGVLQPAGKPATPAAPAVSVVNDTASNSRVANLSWPAVDPQGPTPVHYTVIRTGGGATTNLCADTTQTTCTDTGIRLDGTVYTYAVVAHNAAGSDPAHTSATGPTATMEAAATPDGATDIRAQVVGTTPDGQAPVAFQLGASHGKTSTVACAYNGGACAPVTTYSTGAQSASETLSFPAGYSGSFTLTQCNGSSGGTDAGQTCVTSSPVAVSVNAPPSQPGGGSCGLSGTTVIFNWGAARAYGARSINHYALSNAINGNTGSTSVSVNEPADGGTSTLTVVAVDSNGEQGPAASYTCNHAPPPPTVTVYDAGGCTAKSCPNCTSGPCGFIGATTAHFGGAVTCSVSSASPHGTAGYVSWTQGANESHTSPDYNGWGSESIVVTCNNVSSPPFTWPN